MPNHYHLLLETPEGNLSRTVQWLNASYSVWFNRRHRKLFSSSAKSGLASPVGFGIIE